MYDSIVIGLGPSGVSSAIYLKRFNLNILVIGLDNSSLNQDIYIDNYYGLNHIKGKDLFNQGINQLKELNINIIKEEVIGIDIEENHYVVKTNNNSFLTKTIYLGLGKPRTTKIKGAQALIGKGVSQCAICDGFIYRNKKLAVIGNGSFSESEYQVLLNFTKDITRFNNIDEIKKQDKKLIVIKDNNTYEFDGVFLAEGIMDTSALSKHLGVIENELGYIEVNNQKETNLQGIYSGGDAIGEPFQVVKAVENGMMAAISILNYLKKTK